MKKEKVVLAYSGGLDTSVILKWLVNKGYEVIAYVGNVGQQEDFDAVEKKAYATGASKVYVCDLRHDLVTDYVFPAMKANAIYEGTYMLGTSLARPIIAQKQIEIAKAEGTNIVAHGATGKGNDQVRFEFGYYMHMPDVKIIAPWKDPEWLSTFEGRTDLINYAKANNIPIKVTAKKPYSEDENLIHISHEAGILEDPVHGGSSVDQHLHGHGEITSVLQPACHGGSLEHDGRIEPGLRRMQRSGAACAFDSAFRCVFGKTDHQLDAEGEAGLLHGAACMVDIFHRVSPPAGRKDVLIEGLDAQFDNIYAVMPQMAKDSIINIVGPRRETDFVNAAFIFISLCHFQECALLVHRQPGEAAAVECRLDGAEPAAAERIEMGLDDFLHLGRIRRCRLCRDRALVAEGTLMRTAGMRNEDGDDRVLLHSDSMITPPISVSG